MTPRKVKILKILGSTFAILIMLLIVGYVSFATGLKTGLRVPETIIIRGVSNIDSYDAPSIDFANFWKVWDTLKGTYIDKGAIEDQELLYGAIRGMVNSLGDPYTEFFSPSDAEQFEEDIQGSFSGIGAEIGIKNNQLVVIAPLKDSPAERAGLKSKDAILQIDKKSTTGIRVEDAVQRIRGTIGTTVTLLILRDGFQKPQEISIVREAIRIPVIESRIEDGNMLYIGLNTFNEKAPSAFYTALQEANADYEIKGIILDLRNNPGGYLEVAVNLANWFIDKGDVIVTEAFGTGKQNVFRGTRKALLKRIPTVVLINSGSASASEILAGALRDQLGIKLIGEKSFGKGSVQELRNFGDGSELKVTVAHWILPKGEIIDKEGLTPDIPVAITEKDIDSDRDPQLEKAIEVLRDEIAYASAAH